MKHKVLVIVLVLFLMVGGVSSYFCYNKGHSVGLSEGYAEGMITERDHWVSWGPEGWWKCYEPLPLSEEERTATYGTHFYGRGGPTTRPLGQLPFGIEVQE